MKIIKHLLKNWKLLIGYFTGKTFKEWKSKYNKNPRRFNHDEPWLTLVYPKKSGLQKIQT